MKKTWKSLLSLALVCALVSCLCMAVMATDVEAPAAAETSVQEPAAEEPAAEEPAAEEPAASEEPAPSEEPEPSEEPAETTTYTVAGIDGVKFEVEADAVVATVKINGTAVKVESIANGVITLNSDEKAKAVKAGQENTVTITYTVNGEEKTTAEQKFTPKEETTPTTKPTPSKKPADNTKKADTPDTGDNYNYVLWIAMFAVALVAIAVVNVYSRRRKNQ